MDKKEIAEKALELIKQTYGPGKTGVHKKKCSICGSSFNESNDLDILSAKGPAQCPNCKTILDFQNYINNYWLSFKKIEESNEIYKQQWIKDNPIYDVGIIQSYTLDKYEEMFEVVGRTKRVKSFIQRVEQGRKIIYEQLGPKIEILGSIYERKDRFWLDGGNLMYHLKDVTVEYVIIKLKELIESDSDVCVYKLKNIIKNDGKYLFSDQKVISVKKFIKSGQILKTEYPHFNIEQLVEKLDAILDEYSVTIRAIKDYRDKQFAHFDTLEFPDESEKALTYTNVKRIFNALKIIYDGFYYSIAPDLHKNLQYDYNMWFGHLNEMSEYWENRKI